MDAAKQVFHPCLTSNCRQVVLLVLLANGRNIWMPLSPSQDLARGDACFEALTF